MEKFDFETSLVIENLNKLEGFFAFFSDSTDSLCVSASDYFSIPIISIQEIQYFDFSIDIFFESGWVVFWRDSARFSVYLH